MASADLPVDGLIVLLPDASGKPWRWWRVGADGLGPEHEYEPGAAAAPWGQVGPVTALVPSADAPVTDKPLPDMPPPQALAAERLAQAQVGLGSQPHVAVGSDGERLLSCRVAASAMDHWLAALATEGLDPQALIPAALVLPRVGETLVLAPLGGQLLARTPDAAFEIGRAHV